MKDFTRKQFEALAYDHSLTPAQWRELLPDLCADIEQLLGEPFTVDPDPELDGDRAWFWIWGIDPTITGAKETWSGYVTVGPDDGTGVLPISVTQFFFDVATKQRIVHGDNTIVVHGLDLGTGSESRWVAYGWIDDEFDEWDDVPYPHGHED